MNTCKAFHLSLTSLSALPLSWRNVDHTCTPKIVHLFCMGGPLIKRLSREGIWNFYWTTSMEYFNFEALSESKFPPRCMEKWWSVRLDDCYLLKNRSVKFEVWHGVNNQHIDKKKITFGKSVYVPAYYDVKSIALLS